MNKKRLLSLLALLLLAGCAGRNVSEDVVQERDADIERYYEEFIPAAPPQPCIPARRIRSVEPVGNHSLLFYLNRNEIARSHMRSRCLGLRPGIVLSYEIRIGRLCAGDIVGLLDTFNSALAFSRVGACVLGEFDDLTEEQAEAFKQQYD